MSAYEINCNKINACADSIADVEKNLARLNTRISQMENHLKIEGYAAYRIRASLRNYVWDLSLQKDSLQRYSSILKRCSGRYKEFDQGIANGSSVDWATEVFIRQNPLPWTGPSPLIPIIVRFDLSRLPGLIQLIAPIRFK